MLTFMCLGGVFSFMLPSNSFKDLEMFLPAFLQIHAENLLVRRIKI